MSMPPKPPSYRNELHRQPSRGSATLMVVLGVILLLILLLPGVASLLGSFLLFQRPSHWQSPLLVIWFLGLLVGAFGVAVTVHAIQRRDSDRSEP